MAQVFEAVDRSKNRTRVTVLLLALVAIVLYAPVIGWGLPFATAPDRIKTFATDEILPLEGLAEMHNTFVVSKPDRNYGYPWWHYFVVSAAQGPYMAYLLLSGKLESPSPQFPYGFKNPVGALEMLTLIGRLVSVLMAAGVVISAYYFSKTLWGHWTGLITALLLMSNYLMFYYSRTGNLDVPAFFWTGVGLAVYAKIMKEGFTGRRAILLGIFTGLAIATKDQAVLVFLPLGCALLLPRFTPQPRSNSLLRLSLLALGASIVAYVVGAGMVVDPHRNITHVYRMFFNQGLVSTSHFYFAPHPKTLAGIWNLTYGYVYGLGVSMSFPVLLISVVGVFLVFRSSPRYLVFLLPLLTMFFLLNLPTGSVVLRYFLPLAMFVSAFAANAIVSLRKSLLRPFWIPLLIVLCGWQLLIGADLSYAQHKETRYAATQYLARHAQPGDRIEYFGSAETLPRLTAEIKSRRVAGRTNWVGEFNHGSYVLPYLRANGPEYVILTPDWTSKPGMDRSADCPPEVYEALIRGTVGYTEVASFQTQSLLPESFRRTPLDNPSVCPPVRVFARNDILSRGTPESNALLGSIEGGKDIDK